MIKVVSFSLQTSILKRPLVSVVQEMSWNGIECLMATSTPRFFAVAFAINMCGNCLWEHEGCWLAWKCVSWAHRISLWDDEANFQRGKRLTG